MVLVMVMVTADRWRRSKEYFTALEVFKYHEEYALTDTGRAFEAPSALEKSTLRASPPQRNIFRKQSHVFDYYWASRAMENGSNVVRILFCISLFIPTAAGRKPTTKPTRVQSSQPGSKLFRKFPDASGELAQYFV
jgi:hypothetical protein